MQLYALIGTFLLAAPALAGYNCKCQDDNGQYNVLTENCCLENVGAYRGDLNHQCSNPTGALDSGKFVQCCKDHGVGGAYCWK